MVFDNASGPMQWATAESSVIIPELPVEPEPSEPMDRFWVQLGAVAAFGVVVWLMN